MSFNKVIMLGNLTKDPDLRYTGQGTPVCNFRLAVNSKFGENKDETLFIDIVVWGKQAETCAQYLTKGRSVLVEGRLIERSWEKDGQKHSKMEINANAVRFLGGSKGDGKAAYATAGAGVPEDTSEIEPF